MAYLEVPLTNTDPAFSFSSELEGTTYRFTFRRNERMGIWKYDIATADGSPIHSGVCFYTSVATLTNLLPSSPPGLLVPINFNEEKVNADRFSLGGDVKFIYRESTT